MAKLSTVMRKGLSKSKFGIPSERKYPMPDRAHAANAKARAAQEHNAGRLSAEMKAHIDRMADDILGQ